jgi:Tfp pilus assembly PilM family ATPase
MSQKTTTNIGIEYDSLGIRAAKMNQFKSQAGVGYTLAKLEEVSGSFAKDEDLIAGLRKIRDKMSIGGDDQVVSCVSGKQVYVAQIAFRRLPHEEMINALRFEIRKNLPFEVAGSAIDYQILPDTEKKSELVQVVVTAVANILLNRQLRCFEKAGIKAYVVDVLPLAVGNAFSASWDGKSIDGARAVMHIGPEVSTLVIEGLTVPFYHRNIYFTAAELLGPGADRNIASRERDRRMESFVDEIARSFAYYENAYHAAVEPSLALLGDFAGTVDIAQAIEAKQQITISKLNLAGKADPKSPVLPGKFDVAMALAMRQE